MFPIILDKMDGPSDDDREAVAFHRRQAKASARSRWIGTGVVVVVALCLQLAGCLP